MTLQRAWRRRMRRGTPDWAKGWMLRRKHEKAKRRQQSMPYWQKVAIEAGKRRPFFAAKKGMRKAVSIAAAAASFFSFSGIPQLIQLAAAQSDISTTGRTETTVEGNSGKNATVNITTATTGGDNALNDFGRFNVSAGDTVNLILPDGTKNLLNFVHDGRTVINGDLYSRLANASGAVGGNVWLLNPSGVLVGGTGSVNVGSLTVETPTSDAMNKLLFSLGNVSVSDSKWYIDKEKLGKLDVNNLKDMDMASADAKSLASIASLGKIQTQTGGLNMYTAGTAELINQAYVNVDKQGSVITKGADGNVEIVAAQVNIGGEPSDTAKTATDTTLKASGDISVQVAADSTIGAWAFAKNDASIQVDHATIEGKSVKLEATVQPADEGPSVSETFQDGLNKVPDATGMVKEWVGTDITAVDQYAKATSDLIGTVEDYKSVAEDGVSVLKDAKDVLKAASEGDKDAALDGLVGTASDTLSLVGDVSEGSQINGVSAEATVTVKDSAITATAGDVNISAISKAETTLEGKG